MAAYFENGKNGLMGFFIDGLHVCSVIEFDIDAIPPQVFVAIESAYRQGIVVGEQRKSTQILEACGVRLK